MKARFLRARQPEQKAERRAHLIATARALLESGLDLRALSLNELARRAEMAKANVYRYFETREAVLLAVLWDELREWLVALRRALERTPPAGLDALIKRLARSLAERRLLCALLSALPSVVEQNLSEEALRAFKRETLVFLEEAATLLQPHGPELAVGELARVLYDGVRVVAGLYPFAYPAEASARLLDEPEFRFFRMSFGAELERYMLALTHARVLKAPTRRR